MSGNVSTPRTYGVDAVVLDARLQGRVAVSADVVAAYGDALVAGDVLPPVQVVVVDGQPLVVDGWHRVLAHRQQKLPVVQAVVTEGTWRDALLAAVGANARHGLQRSREDKHRAVRLLLVDPELGGASTRELGRAAGVSHAFVGLVRKHYQLAAGEVLTEARIEQVDGELPAAWAALVHQRSWITSDVRRIRGARSLEEVGAAIRGGYDLTDAAALRLDELAVDPWPWDEDDTADARARRAAQLGERGSLEAALRAVDCPDRAGLFEAWQIVDRLEKLDRWGLQRVLGEARGRPALVEAIGARIDALDADRALKPDRRAAALRAGSAEHFAAGVAEAPPDVLEHLQNGLTDAQLGPVRARLEAIGAEVVECPDPRCAGWIADRSTCAACGGWAEGLAASLADLVAEAAELVAVGVPLEVAGVVVDLSAVHALRALDTWSRLDPDRAESWVSELPAEVRDDLGAWLWGRVEVRAGLAHRVVEARP